MHAAARGSRNSSGSDSPNRHSHQAGGPYDEASDGAVVEGSRSHRRSHAARHGGAASRRTRSHEGSDGRKRRGEGSHAAAYDANNDSVTSHYNRAASRDRYSKQLHAQRRRRTIAKRILIALAIVVVLGAGAAFAYVSVINGNLSKGLDSNLDNSLVESNLNKPFYMLLMGTDESLERDGDDYYAGNFRTDTIILARIDPTAKTVSLISLPRDTMVDMGEYGTQKLNAAYAIGGASAAVDEVSDLAGVDISHFCLVDMDGLCEVVDALGGIEVDVPMTIDDADAGGHLDSGLQTLNGQQALILCRSRNAFEEAGVSGDLARAANQRLVVQAIANKILVSDVGTIASTVTTLSQYVSTDFSVQQIVALAQAFQGMDTANNIWTATMPTESQYINDLWYEIIIQDEWQAMMQRVKEGLPPAASTETDATTGLTLASAGNKDDGQGNTEITKEGYINIRNGTSVNGLGATVASRLESAGYYVIDVANADADNYEQTMVIYNDNSQQLEAQQIAATIGAGASAMKNNGEYTVHDDFLVVLGSDSVIPTYAIESAIGFMRGSSDVSYESNLNYDDYASRDSSSNYSSIGPDADGDYGYNGGSASYQEQAY